MVNTNRAGSEVGAAYDRVRPALQRILVAAAAACSPSKSRCRTHRLSALELDPDDDRSGPSVVADVVDCPCHALVGWRPRVVSGVSWCERPL